jgi:hypothetical protein
MSVDNSYGTSMTIAIALFARSSEDHRSLQREATLEVRKHRDHLPRFLGLLFYCTMQSKCQWLHSPMCPEPEYLARDGFVPSFDLAFHSSFIQALHPSDLPHPTTLLFSTQQ